MQTTPTPRHIPDLLKLLLYVVAVMLGGALLAPWLVHAGMAAFPASAVDAGGASGWLAEKIHGAPFARFFSRASQFWAVLLLWPLIRWAGMDRTLFPSMRPAGSGMRDYALGFALAAGLLLARSANSSTISPRCGYKPRRVPPMAHTWISLDPLPPSTGRF